MAGFNHFPELADALGEVLSQVVRKTAFDMASHASNAAPVDTGFLANSIYVATWDTSTYADKTGISLDLLPEVAIPADEYTAFVAVGANYGIYVEMGTRFMPAQPYFYPAVDAVEPAFEAALAAVEKKFTSLAR